MLKRLTVCLLLLCLLCSVALAADYPCSGIANAKDVRLRAKASTSGKIVTTLAKGTAVTVLKAIAIGNNTWYKVATDKGKTGYILSDYLSVPEQGARDREQRPLQGQHRRMENQLSF